MCIRDSGCTAGLAPTGWNLERRIVMPPVPPLSTLVAALGTLAGLPAISVAVVAAALLIIVADWRAILFILQLLYLALTVVSLRLLPPEWAVLRMLVGALIGIMWYLSARQISRDRSELDRPANTPARTSKQRTGEPIPTRWPVLATTCLLYTSPSPRDRTRSRMPSSA